MMHVISAFHGNQLWACGVDIEKLNEVIDRIKSISSSAGIPISGPIPLPTKKLKVTTRKTPCGEGKASWERYEMRVHKRLIDIHNSTPQTVDALMKLDLPAGIDIEIKV